MKTVNLVGGLVTSVLLGACGVSERPPAPETSTVVVVDSAGTNTHSARDVQTIIDLAQQHATRQGASNFTVARCPAPPAPSAEDCVTTAKPRAIVATSAPTANWVATLPIADNAVVIGPQISGDQSDAHVSIAHSDRALVHHLVQDLTRRPECVAGIATSGDPGSGELASMVPQVLMELGVNFLGPVSPRADTEELACSIFVGEPDDLLEVLSGVGDESLVGLVESSYNSDVRLAVQALGARAVVASTYQSMHESDAPSALRELMEDGRSVDPDFITDPASITAHLALAALMAVDFTSEGNPSGVDVSGALKQLNGGQGTGFGSAVTNDGVSSAPYVWEVE